MGSESSIALKARDTILQDVKVVDCQKGDPPKSDWDEQGNIKRKLLEKHVRCVLEKSEDHKVLVFVQSKDLADELSKSLWRDGFHADSMHGGKPQDERLSVLDQFRKGSLRLLVVTDVLSRGIDIPQVSHVVIHGFGSIDGYVHRIGRTTRGKDGTGHALVFFEYNPHHPSAAAELIELLEASRQHVPEGLRHIAREVAAGQREVKEKKVSKENSKAKWRKDGGGSGGGWRESSWSGRRWGESAWSGRGWSDHK